MYDKQALIDLVRQKALKFGPSLRWASGKKATYYLDGKQVTLARRREARWPRDCSICSVDRRCRGRRGMSIGADPITAAVITMSASRHAAGWLHGSQGTEGTRHQSVHRGAGQAGRYRVIVEDVVTTGGSSSRPSNARKHSA